MSRLSRYLRYAILDQPTRAPRRRPRRGPTRDESYLAFIRRHECCCGCGRGPCEAAHTGSHGLNQKAADPTAIPLWWTCHEEMGRIGQQAFEKAHQVCIEYVIEAMNTEYWSTR